MPGSHRTDCQVTDTLYLVAFILSENIAFDQKAKKVVETMAQVAGADGAALRIPDQSAGGFRLVAATGTPDTNSIAECIPFGQGLVSRASKSKTVVTTDDYANHPDSIPDLVYAGRTSAVSIPILFDDRPIGVFTFFSRNGRHFDDQMVSLISTVVGQIGPLLEHAKLRQELEATDEIARILTSTLDIGDVYEKFAVEMKKLVEFDGISINLIDHQAQKFTLQFTFGAHTIIRAVGNAIPLENSATGHVVSTGLTLVRDDIAADVNFSADRAMLDQGLRSTIRAPLICQGQVTGTIGLFNYQTGTFGAREQVIVERLEAII